MAEAKDTKKKTTSTSKKGTKATNSTSSTKKTTSAPAKTKQATKKASAPKKTEESNVASPKRSVTKEQSAAKKDEAKTTKKVEVKTTKTKQPVHQEKTAEKKVAKKTTEKPKEATTTKKEQPKVEKVKEDVLIYQEVIVNEEQKEAAPVKNEERHTEVKELERVDDNLDKKINKRIDIGILTVIIGLFVLVLTTYLSGEIDLSIEVTRILIVASLVIEAIGMLIMVVNIWKRK